jgi:hypothetical protein
MTRSSFGSGGWLALCALCACTSGYVVGPNERASESTSQVAPPMAAGAAGRAATVAQPAAAAAAGSPALVEPAHVSSSDAQLPKLLPAHVLGVTLSDVGAIRDIEQAVLALAHKPTVRIVFDARRQPGHYLPVAHALSPISYVMGELVDSVDVADMTIEAYAARATEYLDELSELVDIWEIGHDVNGEWLGPSEQVQAKIVAAYRLVKERDKRAALTLFYNQGCAQKSDHELFAWAASHIPSDMRDGLDYVWVSYFEERCHGEEPDWNSVFARLHELFPHSRLGFGACGTQDPARKAELIRHFYTLDVAEPSFVGGYFWWYFAEDMLAPGSQLLPVLNESWMRSPL